MHGWIQYRGPADVSGLDFMAPLPVALVAHRIATPAPTGVNRVLQELVTAALAEEPRRLHPIVVTPPEGSPGPWLPDVTIRRVPGWRPAVQLGWSTIRRPRVRRTFEGVCVTDIIVPSVPVPAPRPIVAHVHDVLPLDNPEWFSRVARWTFARLRPWLESVDAIVVPSMWTQLRLRRWVDIDPARVHVLPLGVRGDRFTPGSPLVIERMGLEPGGYVLAIGEVNARKNLSTLVRGVARLSGSSGPDLVVVGGGPDIGALQAEAASLGIGPRVRFLGRQPDEVLGPLLAGARALVHPSMSEGFGFPPLEAMAAGVPAIAASTASLPEVVGDAGLLVAPDDIGGWAAAIDALADDGLRSSLIALGHQRVSRMTWGSYLDDLLDVYSAVLDGRRR